MRLLNLAMLLAIVLAGPPVPGQAPYTNARLNDHIQKNAQDEKKPAGLPLPVEQSPKAIADAKDSARKNAEVEPHTVRIAETVPVSARRDWMDCATLIMSGVLLFIAVFGVLVAYDTLAVIREQTKATVVSAKAAEENTQALINSQRAWILAHLQGDIRVDRSRKGWVTVAGEISYENKGNGPVWITERVSIL